jgi:hypothetical protein
MQKYHIIIADGTYSMESASTYTFCSSFIDSTQCDSKKTLNNFFTLVLKLIIYFYPHSYYTDNGAVTSPYTMGDATFLSQKNITGNVVSLMVLKYEGAISNVHGNTLTLALIIIGSVFDNR